MDSGPTSTEKRTPPWLRALALGAALALASTSAGGLWLLLAAERPRWLVAAWAVLSAATWAMAVAGAVAFRRTWRADFRAQTDRAGTLARLAESERRRAEAERMALAGRFAAGVAHQINNPLSIVKASVSHLRSRVEDPDDVEAAEDALASVERIAAIVADLRDLAKPGNETLGPVPVDEAIVEALRLNSHRLGAVSALADVEPGLPQATALRRPLVQALVNLIANAADAAREAPPDRAVVEVRASAESGVVLISVDDRGSGIEPEARARLFEPFFTTKGTRGAGLGLALAREYVTRCGGTIEASDRPGGGARFVVRLAAAEVSRMGLRH